MNRKNIERMEKGIWETEDGRDAKEVETEKFKQRLQWQPKEPQNGQKRGSKAKSPEKNSTYGTKRPMTTSERVDAMNEKRLTLEKIRKLQKKILQELVFEVSNWDETYERMEKKNVSIDKETEEILNQSRKATRIMVSDLLKELKELSKDILFAYE